jgi:succinate dehydrogenase / fumarate reductase flavoprotein subunit
MNDLVGIIRREHEMQAAIEKLAELAPRREKVAAAGGRVFNPGWHLSLDLRNMLLVSECVAKAALQRQESRGGHTREDYPEMSAEWRKVNLVCSVGPDGHAQVEKQPLPKMRPDLLALFERSELKKYLTEEELAELPAAAGTGADAS